MLLIPLCVYSFCCIPLNFLCMNNYTKDYHCYTLDISKSYTMYTCTFHSYHHMCFTYFTSKLCFYPALLLILLSLYLSLTNFFIPMILLFLTLTHSLYISFCTNGRLINLKPETWNLTYRALTYWQKICLTYIVIYWFCLVYRHVSLMVVAFLQCTCTDKYTVYGYSVYIFIFQMFYI